MVLPFYKEGVREARVPHRSITIVGDLNQAESTFPALFPIHRSGGILSLPKESGESASRKFFGRERREKVGEILAMHLKFDDPSQALPKQLAPIRLPCVTLEDLSTAASFQT